MKRFLRSPAGLGSSWLLLAACLAVSLPLEAAEPSVALTTACPGIVETSITSGSVDDFTEHTYVTPFAGTGNFSDCQVVRRFGAAIQSLRVTLVSGQADDIGYVGNRLVTDLPAACSRVGAVVSEVDVTDQVQIEGGTATLLLRAKENCCCATGWGEKTEAGRKNALLHWEVTLGSTAPQPGASPFRPPKPNDSTFVVDQGPGLDTPCLARSQGPIFIEIPVRRIVIPHQEPGDTPLTPETQLQTLKKNRLISATATLRLPAFNVDSASPTPQLDRVTFNGHLVPGAFLTGAKGLWRLNSFEVPIEWVNFPVDPGRLGVVTPAVNTVQVDIDSGGLSEERCTSVDWAALSLQVVRPVLLLHGFNSTPAIWEDLWRPRLKTLAIPSYGAQLGKVDTIEANARRIDFEVAAAQLRWGVDRVNIVSHSKGGLDSRHFAESNDSIDQLLQLGTPNAGSPLADVAQGAVLSIPVIGPILSIISSFLVPAGVQLTTPYMAGYNLFHGRNPSVDYTALAGQYDPDCFFLNPFCRPIPRLLLAITGPGDTIVPERSVHALRYTLNRTFFSKGKNQEATHFGLYDSNPIFDRNSDRVRMFGRPKAAAEEEPPGRTIAVGGVLAEGEVRSHTIPVDQGGRVFFSVLYPAGDVEVDLVSPVGRRIHPSVADPDIQYDNGEILGGRMAVYGLEHADPGLWTVEVRALSVDSTIPMAYAAHAWFEAPAVRFSGALPEAAIHAGEPLIVTGRLTEGDAPLGGATVQARIELPDNSLRDVNLHDDGVDPDLRAGDGIYSGRLTDTGTPGFYRVAFTASGVRVSGAPFSREDFGLATASASRSRFTGFRDSGKDEDGDGLFDALLLDVDLDVTQAAQYRLFAVLTDAAGHRHEASAVAALEPGPATIEASFAGEPFFADGVDGPYTLSEVRLAEEGDPELLPVTSATEAHQTAGYSFLQFEHSPIRLSGSGSATGIDTNGNGSFDQLQISLNVDLDRPGSYGWSGQLRDPNGTGLGIASGTASFPAGTNEITLTFDGVRIGKNGVDGPYSVTDLAVFGPGSNLLVDHAFDTPAFTASQFEGAPDRTPPSISVTVTPLVLWPPNHRLVEIKAQITVSDDRDPSPTVDLVSISSSEPENGTGDGDTPADIQGADFGRDDRAFLLRAERSGSGPGRTYVITYRARDAAGNTSLGTATVVVPHNR